MPNKLRPIDWAKLSLDAYNKDSSDSSLVPDGWQAEEDAASQGFDDHGYFGRVYVNDAEQKYVIAHRGTANKENLWSDLELFQADNPPEIFTEAAYPFIQHIMSLSKYDGYQLEGFTGHSLGASLAALSKKELENDGVNIETVLFEFPRPTSLSDSDIMGAKIYNAAPNAVNSMNNPAEEVVRVHVPLDTFANVMLPDRFYFYSLKYSFKDQHGIEKLVQGFNENSGEPGAYSVIPASKWPGGITDKFGKSLSESFSSFTVHSDNPYFWERSIINIWENWIKYVSPKDFEIWRENRIEMQLSSQQPLLAGGIELTGDDEGRDFWGGTAFRDIYRGGAGNDKYRIVGGDDDIADTGGSNEYYMYRGVEGSAVIRDADASKASLYIDGAPYSGEGYEITFEEVGRRLLEGSKGYAIIDDDRLEVMYGKFDDESISGGGGRMLRSSSGKDKAEVAGLSRRAESESSESAPFLLARTKEDLADGNHLSLADGEGSFGWGDFGINSAPAMSFGFPRYTIYNNKVFNEEETFRIVNGKFIRFSIPELLTPPVEYAQHYVEVLWLMPTNALSNDDFLLQTHEFYSYWDPEDEERVREDYSRISIFDKYGLHKCHIPIAPRWTTSLFSTDFNKEKFFLLHYSKISEEYTHDYSATACTHQKPIYLYTIDQNCNYEEKFLFNSNRFYSTIASNGDLYSMISANCDAIPFGFNNYHLSFKEYYVEYYDKNFNKLSEHKVFSLPSLEETYFPLFIEMNELGNVVFSYRLNRFKLNSDGEYVRKESDIQGDFFEDVKCYTETFSQEGRISQKQLVYIHNSNCFSLSRWINNEYVAVQSWHLNNNGKALTISETALNSNLQLVRAFLHFTTENNDNAPVTAGIDITRNTDGTGTIHMSRFSYGEIEYQEDGSWLEIIDNIVIASIDYSHESPILRITSDDLDCSEVSRLQKCYALAQREGDELTGRVDSNAALIGGPGKQKFTVLPPENESGGRILEDEDQEEAESQTALRISEADEEDEFDFSQFDWGQMHMEFVNEDNVTTYTNVYMPGLGLVLPIRHSSNAPSFNMSMGAGGVAGGSVDPVNPMPSSLPMPSSSPMPISDDGGESIADDDTSGSSGGGGSYSGDDDVLPSPEARPGSGDDGSSGSGSFGAGEAGGIVAGLAAAGLLVFGAWKYFRGSCASRKYSSSQNNDDDNLGEDVGNESLHDNVHTRASRVGACSNAEGESTTNPLYSSSSQSSDGVYSRGGLHSESSMHLHPQENEGLELSTLGSSINHPGEAV